MSQINEAVKAAFDRMASPDRNVATAAAELVCAAVDQNMYRIQVLEGAVADGIFAPDVIPINSRVTYPVDPFQDKDLRDFMAWELSTTGGMPTQMAFGDEFAVQVFTVTNSFQWPLDLVQSARYNIIQRYLDVYTNGVLMKNNRDAMRTLLRAAKARAVSKGYVQDTAAAQGKLTPAFYFALEQQMTIRGGGNYGSLGRRKLTDLYVPTDGINQVRTWDLNTVPEQVRQQAWTQGNDGLGIGNIKFHPVDEFTPGQEYNDFWNALPGADVGSTGTDDHFVVGLDLTDKAAAFVHPIVQTWKSWPEGEAAFKQAMGGIYGRGRWGWAVIDDRYTIAGSY